MPNYLLQEDGFYILQEDGSKIVLDEAGPNIRYDCSREEFSGRLLISVERANTTNRLDI